MHKEEAQLNHDQANRKAVFATKEDRVREMIRMRTDLGMTLSSIASAFGVSHQRVSQILLSYNIVIDRRRYMCLKSCIQCGAEFSCFENSKQKFCGMSCKGKAFAKYRKHDGTAMTHTEYIRHKYRTETEFRKRMLSRFMDWQRKRESENPDLRRKRLDQMKEYSRKRKSVA